MNVYKPCLIDRNKIPFKELWQEASCFADDIVCAVGTDFMLKIAEAERKFICDLLNSLQQMEAVDAVPVVRCQECKYRFKNNGHSKDGCPIIDTNIWMDDDDFCSHGEREEGAD